MQSMEKVNVGVIGCGNISEKYLENLCGIFSQTQVIAVTDIKEEAAKLRAEQFHIPRAVSYTHLDVYKRQP